MMTACLIVGGLTPPADLYLAGRNFKLDIFSPRLQDLKTNLSRTWYSRYVLMNFF